MNGLVKAHKEQIAIYKETVEERDKVISQLAQPRKTPVWQKVAESVIPVASIIAIAAAGGN